MSKYAGFSSVKMVAPPRSTFDPSHRKRLSTAAGRLTPILNIEVMPGDKWHGSTEMLVRLAPLLAPIYDDLEVYVHFFFVAWRNLWEEWETFITGGRLGEGIDPVEAPIPPFIDIGDTYSDQPGFFDLATLSDYLGVPPFQEVGLGIPGSFVGKTIDFMPYAGYAFIWYHYYRDRNFTSDDIMEFPLPSGQVADATRDVMGIIRDRQYLKDYFNSALPFTQRGAEVLMPLDGTGTVTYKPFSELYNADGTTPLDGSALETNVVATPYATLHMVTGGADLRVENVDEVQLTSSGVTINDLRTSWALQVWLERNAVAGSRYTESLQAHFAVKPQDYRLQRPEYIGGGKIPIRISEVVAPNYSQNQDDQTVPAGNLGGHGITFGNTNQFSYYCVEHGMIYGIMSAMPRRSYHQGLHKMWRRRSFLDYPWPTFAKLGEQQVDKAELFANATNLTEDANGLLPLFGYQSRYAEWKCYPDMNHGQFHTNLMFWTMTSEFASSPVLGNDFLDFDVNTFQRLFAVQSQIDTIWIYLNNRLTVTRALPYFGTPSMMGV